MIPVVNSDEGAFPGFELPEDRDVYDLFAGKEVLRCLDVPIERNHIETAAGFTNFLENRSGGLLNGMRRAVGCILVRR